MKKGYNGQTEQRLKNRNTHLRKTYGIGLAEYEAIFEAQGRVCAICGRGWALDVFGRSMPVDHDHKTGTIRGVLCVYCNRHRLGRGREDVTLLRRQIDYLENGATLVARVLKEEHDKDKGIQSDS